MSEMPNVINTNVIMSHIDQFWEDSAAISGLAPMDTAVITIALQPHELPQLEKMMQACKLMPGQYNIVQVPEDGYIAWHKIKEKLKPKYVVVLGLEMEQLGISIQLMPHQVTRFNDCCWMPTLSIAGLEQYPDIKKHLWNYGLKPVFVEKVYG